MDLSVYYMIYLVILSATNNFYTLLFQWVAISPPLHRTYFMMQMYSRIDDGPDNDFAPLWRGTNMSLFQQPILRGHNLTLILVFKHVWVRKLSKSDNQCQYLPLKVEG